MFLCSRGRRDGNRVAVVELLNHSQPPNLDARNRSDGRSALMLACSFGHHEIVTLLLAHTPKLSIDLQDNEGLNALMHCSSSGWIEIARLLLTQQPAPDMTMRTNGGSTAIALARNTEMKRYLTFWKGPEMCAAAAGGDLAVVTALLQTGTDVDYQSETGATVLINASKYGRFAVVRYVLANQPRPSLLLKDNNGLDALHHASVGDHQECMHLLLTTKTRNGFTPRLPLPASASTKCMKKACSAAFSLNVWQSGCHFCGLVTCAACVPHTIAVFAPRDNKPMPVCDSCYTTRYRQNMNTLMIACARGKPDAQLQTVQAILTFKPLPRLDDQNSVFYFHSTISFLFN
jgi:ankyrin repeat protein